MFMFNQCGQYKKKSLSTVFINIVKLKDNLKIIFWKYCIYVPTIDPHPTPPPPGHIRLNALADPRLNI